MKTERAKGITEILLSGFCFGFLGVLGKSLFEKGVTPAELLSLRYLLAALILFAWHFLFFRRRLAISGRALLACAFLGAVGYAVFSSFYFYALTGLSASLTVLLLYLYPVLVAIGAWLFFGEKIPRERMIALPIAFAGLVSLVWGDFEVSRMSGLLFGLGSAVFYAVYILVSSRLLKGIDPFVSAAYIQFFAGLAIAIVFLRDAQRVFFVVYDGWPELLALALVCSVAAMALFQAALQKLKSWETSILSLGEPVTGVVLAVLLLDEKLSWLQVLGAVAVLAALVFVSLPTRGVREVPVTQVPS